MYNFVLHPFTKDAIVDWNRLSSTVNMAVRALDEILDYGYELQPLNENRKDIEDYRSIGLGIFGLADALIALGVTYGKDSTPSLLMEYIFKAALKTSNDLAKEKGAFKKCNPEYTMQSFIGGMLDEELNNSILKYGLRNSTLISIAPTGSIASMCGVSNGLEPLFQVSYQRTTHTLVKEKVYFNVFSKSVQDLLVAKNISPEFISVNDIKKEFPYVVDTYDISPIERVELQSKLQLYVDNAISSTINMKKGTTTEEVMEVYQKAWLHGCKGITVFVDGCKRTAIIGNNEEEQDEITADFPTFDFISPLKREDVVEDGDGISGKSYRGSTACVPKLYTQVNEVDGNIFEVFTNTSQGCTSNINTITRLASLALRSGIKVSEIVKELKGSNCSACLDRKRSGKKVSNSCGACIGEAIEKYYSQMKKPDSEVIQVKKLKVKTDIPSNESLMPCPECGEFTLRPEGKCNTCHNCGYSRCD